MDNFPRFLLWMANASHACIVIIMIVIVIKFVYYPCQGNQVSPISQNDSHTIPTN